MTNQKVLIYDNSKLLVEAFAGYFSDLADQKNGEFNVALSGGSTPKIWFEELVAKHKNDLPWERIHFYWGDERCVAPEHAESNYGMTKKYLLDHIDIPPQNVHRIQGELSPDEGAQLYSSLLHQNLSMDSWPVFDLIILGMGDDGHTASIFPHEIDLWTSDETCVVATHPISGQKRISLSGGVINNARAVAFLVTGQNKAEKIEKILHKKPLAVNYPASLVAPVNGSLHWFLDGAAAQKL